MSDIERVNKYEFGVPTNLILPDGRSYPIKAISITTVYAELTVGGGGPDRDVIYQKPKRSFVKVEGLFDGQDK